MLQRMRARVPLRASLFLLRRVRASSVLSRWARAKLYLAVTVAPLGSKTQYTSVPVPGGRVFIGRHSTLIDVRTFLYIWDAEAFPADCADRVVLDIGAHKGYFGVWALSQGAAAVISCEPHSENFEAMRRSHSTNLRRVAWDIERLAVGAAAGRATLFLSSESWAHSLYEHMVEATGSEEIEVIDLRSLLARARARRPDSSIIL